MRYRGGYITKRPGERILDPRFTSIQRADAALGGREKRRVALETCCVGGEVCYYSGLRD